MTYQNNILPGTRVMVFDAKLFIDDIKTPLSMTVQPATVIKRYGVVSEWMEKEYGREAARYPDLVDVIFDHDGRESRGHFTNGIQILGMRW